MQELSHHLPGIKAFSDHIHQNIIPHRPQKFLKIHRVHFDMPLLRRNYNIRYIFPDGHQRSGLHIIKPAVGNQIFQGGPRPRELLYLIKNNQGLPGI